jgi:hypothetical protein
MKLTIFALTVFLSMALPLIAVSKEAAITLPQDLTGIAHMQLSSLLSTGSTSLVVPGMPKPKRWIYDMTVNALPEVSAGWASRGFNADKHLDQIDCISSPESFQAEDYGNSWLYHDDRVYACTWGLETFMMVLRVSFEEINGDTNWANTEVLELREAITQ